MARDYTYVALNAEGQKTTGVMTAENEQAVRSALFARGLAALTVTANRPESTSALSGLAELFGFGRESGPAKPVKSGAAPSPASASTPNSTADAKAASGATLRDKFDALLGVAPIDTKSLILFTKQFRTLFMAGIPLGDVFRILRDQTPEKRLCAAVEDIRALIVEGQSLTTAFRAHSKVFPPLYASMIEAGEQSGSMGVVLERLVKLLAHEEKIRQKTASAVRYPKMVAGAMVGAFVVLLNFVVPQFAAVYSQSGRELPWATQLAIGMHEVLAEWGVLVLAVLAVAFVLLRRWARSSAGRRTIDGLLLKLPVVGPVVQKSVIARFATIFSILLKSGVSILESMDILKSTVDNAFFAAEFEEVKVKIREGESIAKAIGEVRSMSPLAVSLCTIGEQASRLDSMLEELAEHYDDEVNVAVEKMTDSLGPMLILCLGVVILFFALAIFMPMWDMISFV